MSTISVMPVHDPTLRMARLERSVFRLRLLVGATTLAALAAAGAAMVIAMRTPDELVIGKTRVHAGGVTIYDGSDNGAEVNITHQGIYVGVDRGQFVSIDNNHVMIANRSGRERQRPQLLLSVDRERATLTLDGANQSALFQIDDKRETATVSRNGVPLP